MSAEVPLCGLPVAVGVHNAYITYNWFSYMLQKKRMMKVKVKGRRMKMMHNEERVAET